MSLDLFLIAFHVFKRLVVNNRIDTTSTNRHHPLFGCQTLKIRQIMQLSVTIMCRNYVMS